ncbi:MAG TPA: MFS transporter, partial [Bacteroidetes bacterium]|nr:MFS transporter [Bacteroidota bacterium]
ITLSFQALVFSFGNVNAAAFVGVLVMVLALVSILYLKESFSKDLNYVEVA